MKRVLTSAARRKVMQALAVKAAEGNATAAKIYFDEVRAQQNHETGEADFAALDEAFDRLARGVD